jgi:hypothetical protein
MVEDDPHRLCKVELKVAVLESEGRGNAMALTLARDLTAAESRKTMWMMSTVIGWLLAIAAIAFAVIRK